MTRRALPLALLLALSFGACTPEVCEVENLPFLGQPSTPEELFKLAQYAARNDCCDSLYDMLSERTKDEHSRTKFCLFWASLEIPEPFDYKIVDVVGKGEYLTVLEGLEGRKFIMVHYQEPGKPSLDAQLYFVMEKHEQGRELPRLALQEQVDKQGTPGMMPLAQEPAE